MRRLLELYTKYKEYILYIIFGGATTLVNFIIFATLIRININWTIANLIAFIGAVLFAYVTNSRYVFNDKANVEDTTHLFVKVLKFFGTRVATFLIEMILMYIMLYFSPHTMLSKVLVSIIVVILNYIFSKVLVFNT